MGHTQFDMGCGGAQESTSSGEQCCVATPGVYKDVTPAEGPDGPDYLKGCKLIEMTLKKGEKDKITGGPAGPGKTVEKELTAGTGAVMPAGDYEKENVGDGDLEVLIMEVGGPNGTTPEGHYSCLEAEPT